MKTQRGVSSRASQLDKHAIIANVHFLFVIVEVDEVVFCRHMRSPQRDLEIEKQ